MRGWIGDVESRQTYDLLECSFEAVTICDIFEPHGRDTVPTFVQSYGWDLVRLEVLTGAGLTEVIS